MQQINTHLNQANFSSASKIAALTRQNEILLGMCISAGLYEAGTSHPAVIDEIRRAILEKLDHPDNHILDDKKTTIRDLRELARGE